MALGIFDVWSPRVLWHYYRGLDTWLMSTGCICVLYHTEREIAAWQV